jgi:hypothetical protein
MRKAVMVVLVEVAVDAPIMVVDLQLEVPMVEMLVWQIVIVVLHVEVEMVEIILVVVEVVATPALAIVIIQVLAALVYSLLDIHFRINRR